MPVFHLIPSGVREAVCILDRLLKNKKVAELKKAAGRNEPAAFGFAEFLEGSANPARAARQVKAAYLKLTFVLKRLPSRSITSSSRQVPAQAELVFQE
jgi:hypothetical protein